MTLACILSLAPCSRCHPRSSRPHTPRSMHERHGTRSGLRKATSPWSENPHFSARVVGNRPSLAATGEAQVGQRSQHQGCPGERRWRTKAHPSLPLAFTLQHYEMILASASPFERWNRAARPRSSLIRTHFQAAGTPARYPNPAHRTHKLLANMKRLNQRRGRAAPSNAR